MKKILMMLLGVAFATFAWAYEDVTWTVTDTAAKCIRMTDAKPSVEAVIANWDFNRDALTTTLITGAFTTWSDQLAAASANMLRFDSKGSGNFTSVFSDYFTYVGILATYDDVEIASGGSFKVYIVDGSTGTHSFDLSTMTPIYTGVFGPNPIEYLTWDEEAKSLVAATNTNYTVVTKDTAAFEDGKWYVVKDTVELGKITVKGAAHLILCDGAELKVTGRDTLKPGVNVASGKSLTIYGQASGTGALIAFGGSFEAGIGGGDMDACGNITINGGTVTAIGNGGAGIGGGCEGNGGTVTINGGTVTAMSMFGAGIGAGQASSTHGVITFAEGVEFSIVAGDDDDSATETTVDDYTADRSAKYVKIEVGSSKSDPIEYLTWDEETKSLVAATNTSYTVVTADTATFEDGWYIVTNTIERAGIKVNGAAHLILCDGASLKVTGDALKAGIEVPEGSALTIYGQSEGTGALEATGGADADGSGEDAAGIGGTYEGTCGTITINGGTITAICTTYGAAGIGGGYLSQCAATITINGGKVKATGGDEGAGIGSGGGSDYSTEPGIDSDIITINGGEIEAIGGGLGAGIGSGASGSAAKITINGGTITATGGMYGAGIGSGSTGRPTSVTINGGAITASTVPDKGVEAIGKGYAVMPTETVTFGAALASKYVWAGKSATTCELMTTTAFATDHSAAYVELPVETYEVAYDANGATGTMSNDVFAVAKEVTLKKNAFTALGYDFAGWATGAAATNAVVYADEAKDTDFATTNATLTLYAKWNVSTNGVTETSFTSLTNTITKAGQQASTLPITIDFTSDVVIPADAVISAFPTGTGFSGIKYVGDDEGGSNLELEDGVLYGSALRGEVTVDALLLMTIANGGDIPTAFKAFSEGDGGVTVTNDVVKLLGSDGKAYNSIESVLAASPRPETVKLFEIESYTISFDANGGKGEEMPSQEMALGKSICLERNTYTRAGYVFLGWSTDKNATTPSFYNCGAVKNLVDTPDAKVTLYAVWKQPDGTEYTIEFVKNEGSGTLVSCVFTYGAKQTLPTLKNLKWERDGYEFVGWATTPAKARAGSVWKPNGGIVASPVNSGEKLTVYAIWKLKSGYYEVRYWKNDKPTAPGTDNWRTVAYPYGKGKVMPSVAIGLKWTRDGYTFGGWATSRANAEAGIVWKADAAKLVTAAAEGNTLHIYAIWKPLLKASPKMRVAMPMAFSVASTAPAFTVEAPIEEEMYFHGFTADGTGIYDLIVDEDGETGFVQIETEEGVIIGECEVEMLENEIIVNLDDITYVLAK